MSNDKKKVTQQITSYHNDYETGEVKESFTQHTHMVEPEDQFVKFYTKDIGALFDLNKSESEVLFCCLKNMGYNNFIPMYSPLKKQMIKDTGLAMQTINQTMTKLVKRGLFIRVDRGLYLADPHLFGKGRFKDISQLRLTIEYTENGKIVNTEKLEKLLGPKEDMAGKYFKR